MACQAGIRVMFKPAVCLGYWNFEVSWESQVASAAGAEAALPVAGPAVERVAAQWPSLAAD